MARDRAAQKKRRMKQYWEEPSILTGNLCDDPQFDPGTKWTFGTGWTNTTPTATTDGSAVGKLVYDATGLVTAGKTYQVTLSIDGVYGGSNESLAILLGDSDAIQVPALQGNAVIVGVWGDTGTDLSIDVLAEDDFVGTVTNVILKEFV